MVKAFIIGAGLAMAHLTRQDVVFIFGALVAAGYGLHKFRTYVLRPAWDLLLNIVDWSRAHPTLMAIAKEFAPNEGKTLHDRITGIEASQAHERRERKDIQDDVKEIRNMMRTHIADRRPGGNRSTDPQPGDASV